MIGKKDSLRIKQISSELHDISREIKILRHLRWPEDSSYKFFKDKSEKIPIIEYPSFQSDSMIGKLKGIENIYGDTPYDDWLRSKANDILASVNLLDACGTKGFLFYSQKIYGSPSYVLRDGKTSTIDLAKKFELLIDTYYDQFSGYLKAPKVPVETVKKEIKSKILPVFKSKSPDVIIESSLSAKATASSRRIRLRQDAYFTGKDIEQLINHEAFIHVATTLNGRLQKKIKFLASKTGSITKTQEGLAVFSEFITGCIDVNRMYRISDRVIAIQMAIDGADFIEVYRFFLKREGRKNQAFEDTRRVFRGGVLTGGAPFTKDMVYLDGLVRVHNFFRSAVLRGKKDAIELLFSGKVDLDDIPVLLKMKEDNLIQHPMYLPGWITDMNYLVSYFVFSNFVGKMDYDSVDNYYDSLF